MLIYRVLSAIVGIPLLLVLVCLPGGLPFAIAVGVLSLIGVHEFCDGVRQTGARPQEWLSLIGCTGLVIYAYRLGDPLSSAQSFWFLLSLSPFIMLSLVTELFRRERAPIRNVGSTMLPVFYVGWFLIHLVFLRQLEDSERISFVAWSWRWLDIGSVGAWLVLFTFFTTWACDTGAYFAGRAFGKHKLAPSLSPGKTIEGAIGGLIGSVIVAVLAGSILAFPLWSRVVLGVAVAVAAILGDLTESAMKREIGIKDFGSIIPGHGGVLDRFDSLLFVGPTVYYLINLMGLIR